jgi:hypothetical protein
MLTQKTILIKESLKEIALPRIVSIFSEKNAQNLNHFELSYCNVLQAQFDDLIFSYQDCKDRIEKALQNKNFGVSDWTQFWLKEIANIIGLKIEKEDYHVCKINQFLKNQSLKIVFIFDGIENIFQEILTNESQQLAIKALVNLPRKLNEIKDPYFGIIIFIWRDSLKSIITQNLGQFESCYSEFDLDKNKF